MKLRIWETLLMTLARYLTKGITEKNIYGNTDSLKKPLDAGQNP